MQIVRPPVQEDSQATCCMGGPDGPYKIERRFGEREAASGKLVATFSNNRDRFGITHLDLIDRSEFGVGVRSRTPIDPGMIVTLCPEGSAIPWQMTEAARCVQTGRHSFRIGLRYLHREAA